jgi:hypothetical protein
MGRSVSVNSVGSCKKVGAGSGQRPGCLPVGFNSESWLSVPEFCRWKRRSDRWFRKHRREIPGLYGEHKDAQVHVGAHLRGVFPGLRKHF